jgi:Putative beta-barrel porin 2
MGKYFGRIFISLFALLLALPSLAIGGTSPFPDFDVFKEGGVSLEPGDMRLGRIHLHPGFAFETRYDSNILNQADRNFPDGTFEDRTDDFIFTNKPSMGIALERAPGEVFGFNLDYEGRDENFLEEGESQNFFNHEIDGAVNLGGPGGRGDVTIGGGWEKRAGSTSRDLNSNIGARQSRTTTNVYVDGRYSISKLFKLQLVGSMRDDKYQTRKTQNVDEYNLGGSVFWQATKPASFGVKYNHRMRHYETPSASGVNTSSRDNSSADQVFLALRWEPTALISGEVAVGYEDKRYEVFKGDNVQGLVFQLDMLYQPVKRTSVSFTASRENVDSSFRAIQGFVLTSADLGIDQRLGKKVSASIDVLYENLDYRRSTLDSKHSSVLTRIDNSIAGEIGLRYEIQKWLEAKGSYLYEQNFSNFIDKEYGKHVGLLEIAARY